MKKLFLILAAVLFMLAGAASPSAGGTVYELGGVLVNEGLAMFGYPLGEITDPAPVELVFADGFVPTPGGSFTEADVVSLTVWGDPNRAMVFAEYISGDEESIQGTFSSNDIFNGLPEIDFFQWVTEIEVTTLNTDDTITWAPNPSGNPLIAINAIFAAKADYTGIQITGTETNITTNVMVGDTITFQVHAVADVSVGVLQYRFFTRAAYGQDAWGGTRWVLVQDFSPADSVSATFDEAGIYFLACHIERAGEPWTFGDPQTGIVVEVWPTR